MKFLYSPLQRLVMMTTVLLLVGGCASTTEGGAVHAERRQLLLISSAELEKSAAKGYAQLQAEAVKKGTLNTDPALTQRVRMIARRMQPLTGVFRADAPGWKWEVNVISSEELNAFCMPGGKIAFYSGLIKQLNLSDDEIAIVMGHEIAHALREHSREQVSAALAAQTAIGVGAALLGLGDATASLADSAYRALLATRFSRSHEAEADRKTHGRMQRSVGGRTLAHHVGDTVLRMDHSHRSFPFPMTPENSGRGRRTLSVRSSPRIRP